MTPPKPNGSIAVGVIAECSIQQPVNNSEICELVGRVMTPPYKSKSKNMSSSLALSFLS